jgi:hypothetical protein
VKRALWLAVVAGCGNDLPPPGACAVPATNRTVDVDPVALGGPAGFDDLRYSPQLGQVVAAPLGTGRIGLVDPASLAVTSLSAPTGVASADASATTIYAADRGQRRIVAIDVASGHMVAAQAVSGTPDYVRFAPTTDEVWVTLPGSSRLAILGANGLAPLGAVSLAAAPEGLTIDGGRAYTNADSRVVAVDLAGRLVAGAWPTGCGRSHGFPQVDPVYQLAFGGCAADGGVGVVTMQGELRAGFEAGGGDALLAYDPTRHHLYVRGDPGATLYILAACRDGMLGTLAQVPIPSRGHGASADDQGHVWVADATTGGLLRVTDPFPAAP